MPPNPNPIEGRYQHTINAEQRNAKYRQIIQSIVADHTDCFRCRMLSFCDPKCVSWNQIVGTLNTTGVPTPSRARRGMSIRQYNLIPEDVPDHLIPAYRQMVEKIDTGVWDAIQVKRTLRIATKSIVTYL
jgi:hypothetical protein